jgi:hypothetical protein
MLARLLWLVQASSDKAIDEPDGCHDRSVSSLTLKEKLKQTTDSQDCRVDSASQIIP